MPTGALPASQSPQQLLSETFVSYQLSRHSPYLDTQFSRKTKMAPKMVFLMIVVFHMAYSMPVTHLLEESLSSSTPKVTSGLANEPEVTSGLENEPEVTSGLVNEPQEIQRRSISQGSNLKSEVVSEMDENQKIPDEAVEDQREDMETAAGTNILRPLFVYRQQVAYRERMKKARRQAVGSFFR